MLKYIINIYQNISRLVEVNIHCQVYSKYTLVLSPNDPLPPGNRLTSGCQQLKLEQLPRPELAELHVNTGDNKYQSHTSLYWALFP